MDKRIFRDYLYLISGILIIIIYIPHIIIFINRNYHRIIVSDIQRMAERMTIKIPVFLTFLFLLHSNRYFRTLFYYRIGPILSLIIGWWRPGDRYFIISKRTKIGKSVLIAHPYCTVINAESIGDNFSVIHLTTIGDKNGKRPIIGNNVTLGAGVTIIGDITIGDNVTIGAGSVVVKNIPSNCIAVGNPVRVIKQL